MPVHRLVPDQRVSCVSVTVCLSRFECVYAPAYCDQCLVLDEKLQYSGSGMLLYSLLPALDSQRSTWTASLRSPWICCISLRCFTTEKRSTCCRGGISTTSPDTGSSIILYICRYSKGYGVTRSTEMAAQYGMLSATHALEEFYKVGLQPVVEKDRINELTEHVVRASNPSTA